MPSAQTTQTPSSAATTTSAPQQTLTPATTEHRLYPIGALPANDVASILAQPPFADSVTIDQLMQDWKSKSQAFLSTPVPNLYVKDAELSPVSASPTVLANAQKVLDAYRPFLPPSFDLAFVPLSKLVTPQKSLILERARAHHNGRTTPLTDDENAELCLGTNVRSSAIDAALIGNSQNPQNPNQVTYLYQFISEDQDIRLMMPSFLEPLKNTDWSANGASLPNNLRTIPISVGPGPTPIHVGKVVVGTDMQDNSTIHRMILLNGVHRAFRLAELGNQYVAAIVQTMTQNEIPSVLVETPKEVLFSQRPLVITDLANSAITRAFAWKKMKSLIKLKVDVTQDRTLVA